MRALLEVNAPISLLDPDHVHHDRSLARMERHRHCGHAMCLLASLRRLLIADRSI